VDALAAADPRVRAGPTATRRRLTNTRPHRRSACAVPPRGAHKSSAPTGFGLLPPRLGLACAMHLGYSLTKMRAFWTRTLALVTAAMLALPLAVLGQSQYFCRMMERVMLDRCCCQASDASVVVEVPSN